MLGVVASGSAQLVSKKHVIIHSPRLILPPPIDRHVAIHGSDDCNAQCAHVGPVGGAGAKKCDVAAFENYEIAERAEVSKIRKNGPPLPPSRTAFIGSAAPDVNCDGRISPPTSLGWARCGENNG